MPLATGAIETVGRSGKLLLPPIVAVSRSVDAVAGLQGRSNGGGTNVSGSVVAALAGAPGCALGITTSRSGVPSRPVRACRTVAATGIQANKRVSCSVPGKRTGVR